MKSRWKSLCVVLSLCLFVFTALACDDNLVEQQLQQAVSFDGKLSPVLSTSVDIFVGDTQNVGGSDPSISFSDVVRASTASDESASDTNSGQITKIDGEL